MQLEETFYHASELRNLMSINERENILREIGIRFSRETKLRKKKRAKFTIFEYRLSPQSTVFKLTNPRFRVTSNKFQFSRRRLEILHLFLQTITELIKHRKNFIVVSVQNP